MNLASIHNTKLPHRLRIVGSRVERTKCFTQIFKKIEAIVAEKAGRHNSIDNANRNALRELLEEIDKRASKRFIEVQTKRRKYINITITIYQPIII